MSESDRRELIRRYWDGTGDQDITHEIHHDDAVLEFPQSGERFEGVANFQEWRGQYPASVTLEMSNLRGEGDLWVAEGTISYDGGPGQPALNILEFRGDKVARETIYVTEPWDAPAWRAQWRASERAGSWCTCPMPASSPCRRHTSRGTRCGSPDSCRVPWCRWISP